MASIRKRGPYQWEVRVRRKERPTQSKTFESKFDAEAWAATVESEMARGVFRPTAVAERTTLDELLAKYAAEVTPEKRGAVQELSKINVIKRFPICKYSLVEIDGKVLAAFRDARLRDVGKKTVRDDLILLGHVFKVAMQQWGIHLPHGNPVDAFPKPRIGNNERVVPGRGKTPLGGVCGL